ncbi:hypothetical protein AAHA92_02849 [Salvia divinorum]|uniref:Uncharacterized protein n=1 Tax=Salvia divinorum TaxID=28513 RepID=A0ABD1IG91_SALDI
MGINLHFGIEINCADIVIRLELLKVRYNMFQGSCGYTEAYYYRDELEFNRLATMFGFDDVKMEKSHEVITISNTTKLIVITDSIVPNTLYYGRSIATPADSDEVNSPLIDPSSWVR